MTSAVLNNSQELYPQFALLELHSSWFGALAIVNEAPKVQMPRWNDTLSTNTTIHHSTNTATADACIQDFCTAITMQCFSYAIRSQSVLTTIQLGVYTVFSMHSTVQQLHAYHERDSSIACLHNFCAAILL